MAYDVGEIDNSLPPAPRSGPAATGADAAGASAGARGAAAAPAAESVQLGWCRRDVDALTVLHQPVCVLGPAAWSAAPGHSWLYCGCRLAVAALSRSPIRSVAAATARRKRRRRRSKV